MHTVFSLLNVETGDVEQRIRMDGQGKAAAAESMDDKRDAVKLDALIISSLALIANEFLSVSSFLRAYLTNIFSNCTLTPTKQNKIKKLEDDYK